MLPGGRGGDLIIIAAIALIVVGPKNLPKVLREVGRWVGKMRRMADEFRSAFDDMARQSELDDLRKEVEALRQNQPVFDDIKNQMTSIGSGIESSLSTTPTSSAPYTPPPYTPPVDAQMGAPVSNPASDPQMDGLPPGTPKETAPEVTPAPETPPTVIVKKPRARKKAAP